MFLNSHGGILLKGKTHSTEEIIRILRQADGGETALSVCREHNISEQTFYRWKKKYGDDLNYILTFVGGGNNGAVYKADNWDMVGETAGLPKHKMVSMKWNDKEELKEKFVKPTGENKKLIFVTQAK